MSSTAPPDFEEDDYYENPFAVSVPAIIVIVIGTLIAFIGNFLAIFCIYKINRSCRNMSGFHLLCLNHMAINVISLCLVSPWTIMYYYAFKEDWEFTEIFCYISMFGASCLPFMATWNIVLMTLHQLLTFVITERHYLTWSYPMKILTKWIVSKFIPIIIWIVGIFIYGPVAYHLMGFLYLDNAEYYNLKGAIIPKHSCGTITFVIFHHEGIGLFIVPTIIGAIALSALFILKRRSPHPFPSVQESGDQTPANNVLFHITGTDSAVPQTEISGELSLGIQNENDHQFNAKDRSESDPSYLDTPSELSSPLVEMAPAENGTEVPPGSCELTVETVAVSCAMLVSIVVVNGPYAIVILLLCVHQRSTNLWMAFIGLVPWALSKPLFDPIIILAVVLWCRGRDFRRRWCQWICCRQADQFRQTTGTA